MSEKSSSSVYLIPQSDKGSNNIRKASIINHEPKNKTLEDTGALSTLPKGAGSPELLVLRLGFRGLPLRAQEGRRGARSSRSPSLSPPRPPAAPPSQRCGPQPRRKASHRLLVPITEAPHALTSFSTVLPTTLDPRVCVCVCVAHSPPFTPGECVHLYFISFESKSQEGCLACYRCL